MLPSLSCCEGLTMSKKHFIAIAKAIAATADLTERRRLYNEIGRVAAACNPAFNWRTWADACGVEP